MARARLLVESKRANICVGHALGNAKRSRDLTRANVQRPQALTLSRNPELLRSHRAHTGNVRREVTQQVRTLFHRGRVQTIHPPAADAHPELPELVTAERPNCLLLEGRGQAGKRRPATLGLVDAAQPVRRP